MNDNIMQIFTKHTWLEVSAGYYVHMHFIQFIKISMNNLQVHVSTFYLVVKKLDDTDL